MICAPVTWLRQELFSASSPLLSVSPPLASLLICIARLDHRAVPPPFISRYSNAPPRYTARFRSFKLHAISQKIKKEGRMQGGARIKEGFWRQVIGFNGRFVRFRSPPFGTIGSRQIYRVFNNAFGVCRTFEGTFFCLRGRSRVVRVAHGSDPVQVFRHWIEHSIVDLEIYIYYYCAYCTESHY